VAAPSVQHFQSRESKSSGAPNGRFSHPVRTQVLVAGSVGGSNTALWEVPTLITMIIIIDLSYIMYNDLWMRNETKLTYIQQIVGMVKDVL
jgi:hypothetical protein